MKTSKSAPGSTGMKTSFFSTGNDSTEEEPRNNQHLGTHWHVGCRSRCWSTPCSLSLPTPRSGVSRGHSFRKMFFPSSGSALGTCSGHGFFVMHPGPLQISQDEDSCSTSHADGVAGTSSAPALSGGGAGDLGWISGATRDRQDAAGRWSLATGR